MTPKLIVNRMLATDAFSRWLGIMVEEVDHGYCKLKMTVREEMINGFNIAHGGIAYSLADSAVAFAGNSHGNKTVTVSSFVNNIEKIKIGDVLTAIAKEISVRNTLGFYKVEVKRNKTVVATLNGTVYRTKNNWK